MPAPVGLRGPRLTHEAEDRLTPADRAEVALAGQGEGPGDVVGENTFQRCQVVIVQREGVAG
nr:hypothetical protein [Kineosporia sp. NBRC 101731]